MTCCIFQTVRHRLNEIITLLFRGQVLLRILVALHGGDELFQRLREIRLFDDEARIIRV